MENNVLFARAVAGFVEWVARPTLERGHGWPRCWPSSAPGTTSTC